MRQFAKSISLCLLMLLLAPGPAMVWADPGPDPAGFRPLDHSPRWFEGAAPAPVAARTGSWWSRRTTAQKTWFIVGMVVGAYGIYAIASNGSNDNGGSDGGY